MDAGKLIYDYGYATGIAAVMQELVGACTSEQLVRMAEAKVALDQYIANLQADIKRMQNQLDWYAQFDEQHTPPWKAGRS